MKLYYLPQRFDSLSRRIVKLREKMDNVIDSHQHYIAKRLPFVLKRQKEGLKLLREYTKFKNRLSYYRKTLILSPTRIGRLGQKRYLGLFTFTEMQRLRRLLGHRFHKIIVYKIRKS